MKFCKLWIVIFTIVATPLKSASEVFVIDAAKNSATHNNVGLQQLKEGYYAGAIQEFKIAIALNSNSQISATYFDNLGRAYMKIYQYPLAQDAIENAVRINPMCFQYYLNLSEAISKQGAGKIKNEIAKYKIKSKNDSVAKIMVGLLYIKNGDIASGKTILDEFCTEDPKLIVTAGVREYLKPAKKRLNKN